MVDRDLVEQARRGDREAFAILVHQVSDSLYAVAQRILRDPGLAEDALQNALVLAWRRLPHLREPERFEAWIHRILVHACYDESQRARQWTANVRVLPIDGPTTPDGTAAVADRDELERAFRRLPIDQRAVFVLHHYLGLPLVEIAEMLEIPAGTARSRLHYATRGLRDGPDGRAGARCPGRTTRMTDDRSLERAARSWLENGPTQAPDRAVEAALLRIETTPQERDLAVPVEVPNMPTSPLAAAAVIGVLAVGGALLVLGGSPQPVVVPPLDPSTSILPSPSEAAQATPRPTPTATITPLKDDGVIVFEHSTHGLTTRWNTCSRTGSAKSCCLTCQATKNTRPGRATGPTSRSTHGIPATFGLANGSGRPMRSGARRASSRRTACRRSVSMSRPVLLSRWRADGFHTGRRGPHGAADIVRNRHSRPHNG